MDDIIRELIQGLDEVKLNLSRLKRQLETGETMKDDQEVFLSVMLGQPMEDSKELAKEFNLATHQGAKNLLNRATKDMIFSKRVERCVFPLNK